VHSDQRSDELSPYALMSVGDGDLIKAVLLNAGVRRRGRGLRVLEWGAGLSTLSFSAPPDHRLDQPFRAELRDCALPRGHT
jgi:hypothetical protein